MPKKHNLAHFIVQTLRWRYSYIYNIHKQHYRYAFGKTAKRLKYSKAAVIHVLMQIFHDKKHVSNIKSTVGSALNDVNST